MKLNKAIAAAVTVTLQEYTARLHRNWGIYPFSPYWRGYHDGRQEVAETLRTASAGCKITDRAHWVYKDAADLADGTEVL